MDEKTAYLAVVTSIENGKHGKFAVAKVEELSGSATFSLSTRIWKESRIPKSGDQVMLGGLTCTQKGWRANSARFFRKADQQTAEGKEQEMNLGNLFGKKGTRKCLFADYANALKLDAQGQQTWDKWFALYDSLEQDRALVELIESKRPSEIYKKRALMILLAPYSEAIPFDWPRPIIDWCYNQNPDWVEYLNSDLASYALDLIMKAKRDLMAQSNKRVLEYYNNCILKMLEILPEPMAIAILPEFQLREIYCYDGGIDFGPSGYQPFSRLLYNPKIPEAVKIAADQMMRSIVLQECKGIKSPRAEWEHAGEQYASVIVVQSVFIEQGEPGYSARMLADQVEFMLSDAALKKHFLVRSWHQDSIFCCLNGEQFRAIRHKLVKFLVSQENPELSHTTPPVPFDTKTAEMFLAEFGQEDGELAQKLTEVIQVCQRWTPAQAEGEDSRLFCALVMADNKKARTKEQLLNQMK